ncbi:uncharacterized protein [Narcine bancroftii]|uniref:uncharacterized protein n=1 Tax=Narcine bancroftii TaxID=1343680 RepID=UPI003831B808
MDPAEINAIAIKQPPFWIHHLRTWFGQAEVQFQLKNISADATMFYHIVSLLDKETAARVDDLIHNPLVESKYPALKKLLLGTFGLSPQQRASRLLHLDGLGNRTPSALMDEMLGLAEDHYPCFLFHQIFLEQMPEVIQLLLADEDFMDPCRVATTFWCTKRENEAALSQVARPRTSRLQHSPKHKLEAHNSTWCFYHQRWGAQDHKCQQPCDYQGK